MSEVKRCERCGAEEWGYHRPGCISRPANKELGKEIARILVEAHGFGGETDAALITVLGAQKYGAVAKILALVEREKGEALRQFVLKDYKMGLGE